MAIAIVGTWAQSTGRFVTTKTSGTRTTTAGNAIVVLAHVRAPASPSFGTSDVTDSKGNTYTRLAFKIQTNGSQYAGTGIYYCANPGSMGASHTVTYTDTAASNCTIHIEAIEISGQDTAGGADVTATDGNSSSGTPSTGTTAATAQADEIAIATAGGYNAAAPSITATPSGYTDIANTAATDGFLGMSAYKILSATGTQTASWTIDQTTSIVCGAIATIKAAAAVATGMGWANAKGGWW